jgi:hypothetical protein
VKAIAASTGQETEAGERGSSCASTRCTCPGRRLPGVRVLPGMQYRGDRVAGCPHGRAGLWVTGASVLGPVHGVADQSGGPVMSMPIRHGRRAPPGAAPGPRGPRARRDARAVTMRGAMNIKRDWKANARASGRSTPRSSTRGRSATTSPPTARRHPGDHRPGQGRPAGRARQPPRVRVGEEPAAPGRRPGPGRRGAPLRGADGAHRRARSGLVVTREHVPTVCRTWTRCRPRCRPRA